jgi:hypothetical protein
MGPEAAVHGPRRDVCNGWQTGRSADEARTAALDPCATWQIDDGFRFAQPILRIRRWNIGAAVITFRL